MTRHWPASAYGETRMVITAETWAEADRIAKRLLGWAMGNHRVNEGCRPDLPGGCGGRGCNGTLVRIPWQEGQPTLPRE